MVEWPHLFTGSRRRTEAVARSAGGELRAVRRAGRRRTRRGICPGPGTGTRPCAAGSAAAGRIATAEQAGQAGDRDLQLDMTWLVASRAWLVDPAPTARRVLIEAADRLGDPESADRAARRPAGFGRHIRAVARMPRRTQVLPHRDGHAGLITRW